VNKETYDVIFNGTTETSRYIWYTLYKQLSSTNETIDTVKHSWKQRCKLYFETKFGTNTGLQCSNMDKTVRSQTSMWNSAPTDKLIDISERFESGERELCWNLLLDEFEPLNYFSIIFGMAYGNGTMRPLSNVIGYNSRREIGYFCGIRRIHHNSSYDITGTNALYWPSKPLKSGDTVQMKFKLLSATQFDVIFSVNGVMEQVPVRISAKFVLPGVSLVHTQQVTINKLY
jgi:hypothetical protein